MGVARRRTAPRARGSSSERRQLDVTGDYTTLRAERSYRPVQPKDAIPQASLRGRPVKREEKTKLPYKLEAKD